MKFLNLSLVTVLAFTFVAGEGFAGNKKNQDLQNERKRALANPFKDAFIEEPSPFEACRDIKIIKDTRYNAFKDYFDKVMAECTNLNVVPMYIDTGIRKGVKGAVNDNLGKLFELSMDFKDKDKMAKFLEDVSEEVLENTEDGLKEANEVLASCDKAFGKDAKDPTLKKYYDKLHRNAPTASSVKDPGVGLYQKLESSYKALEMHREGRMKKKESRAWAEKNGFGSRAETESSIKQIRAEINDINGKYFDQLKRVAPDCAKELQNTKNAIQAIVTDPSDANNSSRNTFREKLIVANDKPTLSASEMNKMRRNEINEGQIGATANRKGKGRVSRDSDSLCFKYSHKMQNPITNKTRLGSAGSVWHKDSIRVSAPGVESGTAIAPYKRSEDFVIHKNHQDAAKYIDPEERENATALARKLEQDVKNMAVKKGLTPSIIATKIQLEGEASLSNEQKELWKTYKKMEGCRYDSKGNFMGPGWNAESSGEELSGDFVYRDYQFLVTPQGEKMLEEQREAVLESLNKDITAAPILQFIQSKDASPWEIYAALKKMRDYSKSFKSAACTEAKGLVGTNSNINSVCASEDGGIANRLDLEHKKQTLGEKYDGAEKVTADEIDWFMNMKPIIDAKLSKIKEDGDFEELKLYCSGVQSLTYHRENKDNAKMAGVGVLIAASLAAGPILGLTGASTVATVEGATIIGNVVGGGIGVSYAIQDSARRKVAADCIRSVAKRKGKEFNPASCYKDWEVAKEFDDALSRITLPLDAIGAGAAAGAAARLWLGAAGKALKASAKAMTASKLKFAKDATGRFDPAVERELEANVGYLAKVMSLPENSRHRQAFLELNERVTKRFDDHIEELKKQGVGDEVLKNARERAEAVRADIISVIRKNGINPKDMRDAMESALETGLIPIDLLDDSADAIAGMLKRGQSPKHINRLIKQDGFLFDSLSGMKTAWEVAEKQAMEISGKNWGKLSLNNRSKLTRAQLPEAIINLDSSLRAKPTRNIKDKKQLALAKAENKKRQDEVQKLVCCANPLAKGCK